MHQIAGTIPRESRSFQFPLSRYAPITAAMIIGTALGVSWALGRHTMALAPAVVVVLLFFLARWTRWFFVSLCVLWLAPVILGVRFVSDFSLSDPAVFVLFLLFLARETVEGRKIDIRGPLLVPFLLLFGAQALSAAVMVFRSPRLFFYKDLFPFVRLLQAYLLCVMVSVEVKRGGLKPMLIGAGIVASVAVGIGFLEHLGDYVIPALKPFSDAVREHYYNPFWRGGTWPAPTLSRVGGTFEANPNKLGAFASILVVTTFALILYRGKSSIQKIPLGALFVVSLLTVIFTGSRGALLNIIVGVGGVVLLSQRGRLPRKVLIAAGLACLVVALIVHFSPRVERYRALVEFTQRGAGADSSFYKRIGVLWKLALEEFVRNPIVGRGTTVRLVRAIDNLYVWTLVRFGILGLLTLGYFMWRVVHCGLWVWKSGDDDLSRVTALALVCVIGGLLAQSLTADLLSWDRLRETYWIAFGLIAGMYGQSATKEEVGDANPCRLAHVP